MLIRLFFLPKKLHLLLHFQRHSSCGLQCNTVDVTTEHKENGFHMQALCNNHPNHSNEQRKTSWHSPPKNPLAQSFFFQEKDHCSFDLQQIGRLVAHHSAVTLAFIYLHMQARMKNVLNPHKPRCRKHAAHEPDRQKFEGC